MHGLHKLALAATLVNIALFAGTSAHAQYMNGSLSLVSRGVMESGSDLSLAPTVTTLNAFTSGAGVGDYSAIPLFTQFSETPLVLSNPMAYSLGCSTWGSFTPSTYLIVTHTAAFYEVLLFGSYAPGSGMPGKLPTPGELRLSINQSGQSLSEAITLVTVGPAVPEPGSAALLVGLGVSSAGFLIRRRRK